MLKDINLFLIDFNLIKLSTNPTLNSQIDYKKTDNDESNNNNISSNISNIDFKNKSRNLILKIEKKQSPAFNNITFGDNDNTHKDNTNKDTINIDNKRKITNNNNKDNTNKDTINIGFSNTINKDNTNKDSINIDNNNNISNTINKDNTITLSNNDNTIKTDNKNKIKKFKTKIVKKKLNLNDYEMNSLSYEKALKLDKRQFWEYYISLIRTKQVIVFTFFIKPDYNSSVVKIDSFFLSFAIYFGTNALFFTDETMHQIHIDHGIYNFVYQLPQIVYSKIISKVIDILISFLSITEENISDIRKKKFDDKVIEREKFIKCTNIKFILFFIVNFIFLGFIWYYLSAFGAVYKNTQSYLLKDTFASFATSLVSPFLYNLLPCIIRIYSLQAEKKNRNI